MTNSPPPPDMKRLRPLAPRAVLASATLLFLIGAIFWPLLGAGFLDYDDPDFVTNNTRVLGGLSGAGMAWAFKSLYIYWQPLTWLSYMVDVEAYGLSARGFHLTNLALHGASTVLLFLALLRMTGRLWSAAIVAALFALHPLHVESVAWISERKGVLSSTFWMLSLVAYAGYAARPTAARLTGVALCFALGLMAKSMVITLPCVLLLLDVWPLRRASWPGMRSGAGDPPADEGAPRFVRRTWAQLWLEKLPLFALSGVSAFLTVAAQKEANAIWSAEKLPMAQRLAHGFVTYATYLRKALLPVDLAVFYPHPLSWPPVMVLAALGVLGALTALAIWQLRRRPYVMVGWLWYLGTLFPVSGFFQTGDSAFADRYTYLPLIGIFIAATWALADGARHSAYVRRVMPGLGTAVLLLCAGLAHVQSRHWLTTERLFEQAARVTRDNYLAYAVLGSLEARAGRIDVATEYLQRSLAIKPDYFEGFIALADALAGQGRLAEATVYYERAIQANPRSADALNGLGAVLVRQQQYAAAIARFTEAIERNPNLIPAYVNRAVAYQGLGRWAEATDAYRQLLAMRPGSPELLLGLANVHLAQRQFPQAIQVLRELLQVEPDSVEALSRLAWLLATNEDAAIRHGPQAVQLATRACELTQQKNPQALNALAAAYAETGQWPAAIGTASNALELAKATGQSGVAGIIQNLLESYRAQKPYRDTGR